jgi:predicted ATPase/DNA-binding CsgD family transcriptional regulator
MQNPTLSPSKDHIQDLTWREKEILGLLVGRLSDKEIAETLHLALSTVKWYNRQIFTKLGVTNRKQAAKKAEEPNFYGSHEILLGEEKSQLLNNLPSQLSSFVGRNKEIVEIKQLLESSRLITLTGAGGSGKTRLALQIVQDMFNSYSDGVWLVELAVITDPTTVPYEIASVLGVHTQGDNKHADLKRFLERKHLLLVLDNFEHVDDAAPLVAEILAAAPKLSVLVTSRAKLNVYGEQEYPVSSLSLPDLDQVKSTERLLDFEAIDLFVQRAKASKPGLILDSDDINAAAQICVRLDGLPLAIELAAPLAKIFDFTSLAQRLGKNLADLPEGPRNLPERQRTLRATMDWSYQLLEEGDKNLFDRLSIFSGGGTLEAIESICSDGVAGKMIDRITSLVEKNLLVPTETVDGDVHFMMLDTIKEYGHEHFVSRPDTGDIIRKFAAYYADLAELSRTEIRGPRHSYWFKRLKVENQNFRFALAESLDGDQPEFGFRMIGPLSYYWYYNGLIRENSRWIDIALEKSTGAALALRVEVMRIAGIVAYNLGDLERSRGLLQKALKINRQMGDELSEGLVLAHLAMASLRTSKDLDKALSMALNGLEIFKYFKNKGYMALAYDILGEVTRLQGDYKAAKMHYQHSLALSQETGEVIREATLHANLGVIAFHQADYKTAYQSNMKGLSLSMELPSTYRLAHHLALLAGPLTALNFANRAARILGAAEAELDKKGDGQKSVDRPDVELYISNTQNSLGEKAFLEAWQEGQRMSLQEAADYALSEKDEATKE